MTLPYLCAVWLPEASTVSRWRTCRTNDPITAFSWAHSYRQYPCFRHADPSFPFLSGDTVGSTVGSRFRSKHEIDPLDITGALPFDDARSGDQVALGRSVAPPVAAMRCEILPVPFMDINTNPQSRRHVEPGVGRPKIGFGSVSSSGYRVATASCEARTTDSAIAGVQSCCDLP